MAFTPKVWLNDPITTTPLDAAGLIDLETRLAADSAAGVATEAAARTSADATLTTATAALTTALSAKADLSGGHVPVAQLGSGTPAAGMYPDGTGAWLPLPSGGVRTISVVVPGVLGGEGLQSFNHAVDGNGVPNFDCAQRGIIVLPERTSRWRLRIANRSAIYNTAMDGAGTIDVAGLWVGPPETAMSRWTGAFAAAPTQVLAAATGAIVDTTEWVSPWVTGVNVQLGPQQTVLSLGVRAVGTLRCYYDDERGFCWIAPGAAAGAGAVGAPGGAPRFNFTSLDIRVEYEVESALPLVWVFGDSIASGYSPTPNIQQFETWPAQAAVASSLQVANFGISSAFSYHFNDATRLTYQWTRMNVGAQVPDVAVIGLGTNDIGIGQNADNPTGQIQTLIMQLRAAGVPRIIVGTLVPMEFAGATPDVQRQIFNGRVRNHWWSVNAIADFDRALRSEYASATSTADLMDPANAHPTVAGYAAMASVIRG